MLFRSDGGQLLLEVDGHAGRGPVGQDIVCAAASVLCCTLAETLRWAGAAQEAHCEVGHCRLQARETALTRAYFGFVETGLQLLTQTYPLAVQKAEKSGGEGVEDGDGRVVS